MSDEELVAACNALANKFGMSFGWIDRPDFKYYEATHPLEVQAWNLAVIAYEHITDTPIEDALSGLE